MKLEALLNSSWDRLSKYKTGRKMFSYALGKYVRFSGSVDPLVEELRPGYARVSMIDQPKVRNHLDSIHACAMTVLGELAGNLALQYTMGVKGKFIVKDFFQAYDKKARGTLNAICHLPEVDCSKHNIYEIVVKIYDKEGLERLRADKKDDVPVSHMTLTSDVKPR